MPSLADLGRDTRRRLRGATLGTLHKAASTASTVAAAGAADVALFARDLVAPSPHVLADAPPGSGLRPVLGDADEPLLGSTRPMATDRVTWGMDKHARYGNLWWAMVAGRRFVQVTGGDATRQVLVNSDKEFSNDGWGELIGRFFGGGLMLMSFGEHLDHRRIMQSAFTPTRLQGYLAGMDRRVVAELATWRDGRHLMYPTLKDLGLRIATDVFLGLELPGPRRQQVLASFHAQARAPLAALRLDLPLTRWGAGRSGYDHVLAFFHEHLADKRAEPGDDLFSALVHARDEGGAAFTDDEVVRHMNFLWFAAHDTTNLAMTMMAWAFAAHPAWQERAREEALALGDGPLRPEDLQHLEAIDLVLREVMRLWPPVPAALRRAVVDTAIDGHFVPAGTWLHVFPVVTHRMEQYWERPDEFDPERFLPPRQEHRAHSHAYLPFGGGVHKCIGFAFAEMEARAVFARLLREFELTVPDGYVPPMGWGGLPEPLDQLPVTVARR